MGERKCSVPTTTVVQLPFTGWFTWARADGPRGEPFSERGHHGMLQFVVCLSDDERIVRIGKLLLQFPQYKSGRLSRAEPTSNDNHVRLLQLVEDGGLFKSQTLLYWFVARSQGQRRSSHHFLPTSWRLNPGSV